MCVRSHTVCRVFINLFTIYLFSLRHGILETRSVHGQWLCFCAISVTLIKCFIGCFAASLIGVYFASLLPQQVKFICCGLPCLVQGRLEFKASLIETLKSYRLQICYFMRESPRLNYSDMLGTSCSVCSSHTNFLKGLHAVF